MTELRHTNAQSKIYTHSRTVQLPNQFFPAKGVFFLTELVKVVYKKKVCTYHANRYKTLNCSTTLQSTQSKLVNGYLFIFSSCGASGSGGSVPNGITTLLDG